MTDWLLHKYVGLLSTRLRNFKRKGPNLYNFSCPICNDSDFHKRKARGYIYEKGGNLLYHCHNCDVTMATSKFIKTLDQNLFDEYIMEKLRENKSPEQVELETFTDKMKKPIFLQSGPLKKLKKVSQLSIYDPVKKFVESRKIPTPFHAKLFSCPTYKNFTNELLPDKFDKESLERDETRLLIPYFDKNKKLIEYNCRAIGASAVKYVKIVLETDSPHLYGLDMIDLNRPFFVFEGEIDSMFIKNALATGGGDLISAVKSLSDYKHNMTIVYDNEPRSHETIKKLDKTILNGYNVVIWPDNLEHKDVNEMVLAGMSGEFVEYIIKQNTYRDLAAKMALTKWRKL